MSDEYTYDLATRIAALQKLNADLQDGLKMFRLVGPGLDPEYNDQVGVAESQAVETMVSAANRSGKSLSVAAVVAAFARDKPLLAYDDRKIYTRAVKHRGQPVTVWSIGFQLNHIGETMFRLLFEPGQFRCIQDPDTGALRAWKPWLPTDAKLADATVPAPPLIPPSAINQKSWVWENKAAKQVVRVDLKNGTRFHFYPSSGEVKKGDPVHLIWIDELIQNSEHYPEWIARLTDFEGRLIWASMQYKNCPAIPAFIERESLELEEIERGERDPKNRITKVFTFKASGNPYLPKERLEINRRLYETMGDDVVAQRMDGGDVYDATLIYPYFNRTLHAAFPPNEDHWDDLAKVLHPLSGIPPKDWTHELAIDPGAQKPAVLFMATPPKVWKDENGKEWSLWSEKPYFVPYDEIYGQRYTLKELCELIQIKMRGIRFRRFIMDMQGGRISSMVGGASPKILFAEEFARLGIESQETGINFVAGSPDFRKRKRIVEDWMQVQPSGYPQLRIANKRCPHLVWQLANNQLETKDKEGRLPVDKPKQRERNDLRTCLEYIASLHPTYVPVPQHTPLPDWYQRAMEWEGKFFGNESRKSDRCHFGPGVAP